MTIKEAISILEEHNKWRRSQPPYDGIIPTYDLPSPKEIGEAIDVAIRAMRDLDL